MAHLSDFTHLYHALKITDCSQPMQVLSISPKNPVHKKYILVIQEIFGINDSLKQTCMDYANLGYHVLCPDLFHRLKAGVNLTDSNPDDLTQAFDYFNRFDVETGITDIQAVIDYAHQTLGASQIGAVGYCLGGFLAYLTACRTNIDASVSFYGVNIQNYLHEANSLTKPLMLHIAGNDEFVPHEAQWEILNAFKNITLIEAYQYNNAQHAFARVNGVHFDEESAKNANQRTQAFFEKNL